MSQKDLTLIKIKRINKLINLWDCIEKKVSNIGIKEHLQNECVFLIKKILRTITL